MTCCHVQKVVDPVIKVFWFARVVCVTLSVKFFKPPFYGFTVLFLHQVVVAISAKNMSFQEVETSRIHVHHFPIACTREG